MGIERSAKGLKHGILSIGSATTSTVNGGHSSPVFSMVHQEPKAPLRNKLSEQVQKSLSEGKKSGSLYVVRYVFSVHYL